MRILAERGKRARRAGRAAYISISLATLVSVSIGCNRAYYRTRADAQAYAILAEKSDDPRWTVPRLDTTPDPRSRFFDPFDPDYQPLPPDDPAAHRYMHHAYGMKGWKHWHDFGDVQTVENPDWPTYFGGSPLPAADTLPRINDLSLHDAIEVGLMNSRDYQEQLENVYLAALALSFERYRFDVRPRGFLFPPFTNLFYDHQPDDASNLRLGPTGIGVRKLFPTGGQFIAELTNNTIWMFSGPNGTGTATTFAYSLVQPLLRGAGRQIAMEDLTQSERTVLYALRDFARFRKDFYVTIVTGSRSIPLPGSAGGGELAFLIQGARSPTVGFYFLLFQLQRLRNQKTNVQSLESLIQDLQQLAEAGRATTLDITQLESSLAVARRRLLLRRRQYRDELDRFKVQLGLPPDMELTINDALLEPFQFLDSELRDLESKTAGVQITLSAESLAERISELMRRFEDISSQAEELDRQFGQLDDLAATRMQQLENEDKKTLAVDIERDRNQFREIQTAVAETKTRLEELATGLKREPPTDDELTAFVADMRKVRGGMLRIIRELIGLEISVRLELITLPAVDLDARCAVDLALQNRLDLMNRRAIVMDARRIVEIAADRLETDLNLVAEGEVSTPPLAVNSNPVHFRAKDSSFRTGVSVVTPLDRRAQRNDFRAAQIAYQRARRNFMAAEDQVKLDVRRRLRNVKTQAGIFEINRRGLRIAARELDQAIEFAERPGPDGRAGGQGINISRALDNILNAQNELINSWVNYETARLALYRDMGVMQIDEFGLWKNDPKDRERPEAETIPLGELIAE